MNMDIKNNLIEQITRDLKIYQFNDEGKVEYLNRVIYSAIAAWVIHSTCDKSFNENYTKGGVSKSYITKKFPK